MKSQKLFLNFHQIFNKKSLNIFKILSQEPKQKSRQNFMLFRRFLAQNNAVASLEFALLALPYFLILFVIIQALLLSFKVGYVSYVFDTAARNAVFVSSDTTELFEKLVYEKDKLGLIDSEKTKLEVLFCENLADVLDDFCYKKQSPNSKIAKLSLELDLDLKLIPAQEIEQLKRSLVLPLEKTNEQK